MAVWNSLNYVDPMQTLAKYQPTTYQPNYPKLGEGTYNTNYNNASNGNTYSGIYNSNAINNHVGSLYNNPLDNSSYGSAVSGLMGYTPTTTYNSLNTDNTTSAFNLGNVGNSVSSTLGNFGSGSNFSYGSSNIANSPSINLPNVWNNGQSSISQLESYSPSTGSGILPKNQDGSTNWFGNGGVIQGIQSIVGIGQSIFNMWQGYKQQKLMKEAFEETKRFNHANYQAMAKSHNANIRDQMSGRMTTLSSAAAKNQARSNYQARKVKEDY